MKLKITKVKNSDGKIDESKRLVISGEIKFTMRMRGRFWEATPTVDGQRHQLNLRTADPQRAAKTAIDKIRAITKQQWDFVHAGQATRGHHTIGEVCELFRNRDLPGTSPETTKNHIRCLLKIVRVALDLKPAANPKYTVNADKSRTKIEQPQEAENISTTLLTADLLKKFQQKTIEGLTGKAEQDARRSANAATVNGRSVFEKHLLADNLYPNLPDISGFKAVGLLKFVPQTFKYNVIAPWCEKVFANLPELRESDPAAYLFIRLAAGTGLRRGEISEARNSWITGPEGSREIQVQPTETWIPKGRKERTVPLGEDIYHDILALTDGSEWIIPASNENQRKSGIPKRINEWMISLGWPFEKKLHELRKWFGAQVATQTRSLFAAQRILGHASSDTTDRYYADIVKPPEYTITMGVGQGERKQRLAVNN